MDRGHDSRNCPYVGLDYYHENLGGWFFGRDTERGKIITNLQAARLTLLHATSGVGKSSLLNAGVACRLRQLAFRARAASGAVIDLPVVFNSWQDDPVSGLVAAMGHAISPFMTRPLWANLPTDRLDVAIDIAADVANANLLIICDQFEEYFLYSTHESPPERFADELVRCINRPDIPASFLISIREDAYAGLGDLFRGRISNVYGNYLHLDYLDRPAAEQAIRAPLEVYNNQPGVTEPVGIDNDLVNAVLDQIRAQDADGAVSVGTLDGRVSTPLLQLVMGAIWDREWQEGSHQLRLATLDKVQGVEKIVDSHLSGAMRLLKNAERSSAIDMFDYLVTPSGGKIAQSVPDLANRTGHSERQVGDIFSKLDRARIVRPVPAPAGRDPVRYRRYEIFHDVLAPAINRQIAVHEEQHRTRRLWRLTATGAAAFVALLAVTSGFFVLWRSAQHQSFLSESRQLAAVANLHIDQDPELSVLLALQALRIQDTSQAEQALRAALPDLQTVRAFRVGTTVYSVAVDPVDANKMVTADRYGIVSIWDVKTGYRRQLSLGGFYRTGAAESVAFNPTGTKFAVDFAGNGTTFDLALFDAHTAKQLKTATLPGSPANNGLAFIGATSHVAVATDKGLKLWEPDNQTACCQTLNAQTAYSMAANPVMPGEFAVGTAEGPEIWTMGPDKLRQLQRHQVTWSVLGLAFSPDGHELATADSDGKVRVYSVAARRIVTTLDGGDDVARSVAFSPDGHLIAAGFSNGTTRVWDRTTGLQLTNLAGHADQVEAVRFSTDSAKVVTVSDDGTIRVWYPRPRELAAVFGSPQAQGSPLPMLGAQYISANRIIALDDNGNLGVFTPQGSRLALIGRPDTSVSSASWNRTGTVLVTVNSDDTVDLWHRTHTDYTKMQRISTIHVKGGAREVTVSPDGSVFTVLTNRNYYQVQVRDGQTAKLLHSLVATNSISTVAITPDGHRVVAGDYNGQLEVWDPATEHRQMLGGSGPQIKDTEFDESGNKLVTASASGTVTVWATTPSNQTLVSAKPLIAFNACPSLEFASPNPDGTEIVVACGNSDTLVFDASTGQQLTVLPENSGEVGSAAFSPDGKSIITVVNSHGSGGVQIWKAELADRSPSTIVRIAEQRTTRQLTPAERKTYLAGVG